MMGKFTPGHPRIVPGRGRFTGQVFVLHGCMSDGPYTWRQAHWALQELIRNPIAPEVYADFEARGFGGMATHFLTDDLSAIDPDKIADAILSVRAGRP